MTPAEWIGAIGGTFGAITGVLALWITWRNRADRRWLRRRDIPGELVNLDRDHADALAELDATADREMRELLTVHMARDVNFADAFEADKRRHHADVERRRAKLERDYEARRDALRRELDRLGGPPKT